MEKYNLESVNVYIGHPGHEFILSVSPQEAFTLLMMPGLAGLITKMIPNYELSEMPEE